MGIKEQVLAKEKAYNVIYSCKTHEQLEVAERYLNNYLELYEDGLGFNMLKLELNETLENLDNL